MGEIGFAILILGLIFGAPLLALVAHYIERKYPERRPERGRDF